MSLHLPFHTLEPTFAAGLIDDPILLVRVRPTGRQLMFDCGQLHHLAKRSLNRLDALFISHAHMDHWMGIDSVIRAVHATPRTVNLFGPPGLADKFTHKLAGYDWNLAEPTWGSFRVNEVFADRLVHTLFTGPEAFQRHPDGETLRADDAPIYRTPHLEVHTAACEHRVQSQIYRINERLRFLVDKNRMMELGLEPGPWLGALKRRVLTGQEMELPLNVLRRNASGVVLEETVTDPCALLKQIERPQTPASIGYVSDVGYSENNRESILGLLRGVDLLLCECTFLQAGKERARASQHLCTADVNELLEELQPSFFLPMHLSKAHSQHAEKLYSEIAAPSETTLLQLPVRRTPRPLLACEMGWEEC